MVFKTVILRHTLNPHFDQNFVFPNLTPDCLERKSLVYDLVCVCVSECVFVRSGSACACVGDGMCKNASALVLVNLFHCWLLQELPCKNVSVA